MVLPAPLGPSSPNNSPANASKLTPSSAVVGPYALVKISHFQHGNRHENCLEIFGRLGLPQQRHPARRQAAVFVIA